ncbi:MAG: hypothetical protein NTX24_01425 [Candidatus Pacearchaeota archaeon]|nr:hypothetical protein [Candidatus Pacearchaeota archaeon]
MTLENENKVSEHQTKLVKEDAKTNSDKVMPENTINKLKEIINYLKDSSVSNMTFGH